jgi:hypothetical protein
LKREGAQRAIKAGFRRAQLLPKRLAAGCQFVTNFNEPPRTTVSVGVAREFVSNPAKADKEIRLKN